MKPSVTCPTAALNQLTSSIQMNVESVLVIVNQWGNTINLHDRGRHTAVLTVIPVLIMIMTWVCVCVCLNQCWPIDWLVDGARLTDCSWERERKKKVVTFDIFRFSDRREKHLWSRIKLSVKKKKYYEYSIIPQEVLWKCLYIEQSTFYVYSCKLCTLYIHVSLCFVQSGFRL